MKNSFQHISRVCLCAMSIMGAAWGGQTFYGASGYSFVPDGFVDHGDRFGGYFAGEFVSLPSARLYPKYVGLRMTTLADRLELSLSSTYAFVTTSDGYDPKKIGSGLVPIVPGLKWNIDDIHSTYVRWGYSAGAMFPYGAYFSTTASSKFPILSPELTVAMATTFVQSMNGMIGGRLRVSDLDGKPLPVAFTGEGGWAGSTNGRLGETREAFWVLGLEVQMGRNIEFNVDWRKDPRTYKDSANVVLPGQNTDGVWSLKLDYHFNGVKQVKGAEK